MLPSSTSPEGAQEAAPGAMSARVGFLVGPLLVSLLPGDGDSAIAQAPG
jgi:hypothetical protein